jgi:hypothetical protein
MAGPISLFMSKVYIKTFSELFHDLSRFAFPVIIGEIKTKRRKSIHRGKKCFMGGWLTGTIFFICC